MTQVGQDSLGIRSTLTVGGKDYAYYSLKKAAAKLGDIAATLAFGEGLQAHAQSAIYRKS